MISRDRVTMDTDGENVGLNEAIDSLEGLDNYRNWILDEFRPHLAGHTVEIGAGSGSFSKKFIELVPTLELVEPSHELFQRLCSRLGHEGRVQLHMVGAEKWLLDAESASRDTIIMVNVLEHIEDDVGTLRQIHRTLRPGGALLLFVPALRYLFSRLDREHGHFRRYEKRELETKVREVGFDIAGSKYVDTLGIIPWLVFNKWLGRTEFDKGMVRLYDSVGIPVTRLVERLLPLPVGKNVLLIAKKRP